MNISRIAYGNVEKQKQTNKKNKQTNKQTKTNIYIESFYIDIVLFSFIYIYITVLPRLALC